MDRGRIDDLFAEALAHGAVPAGATPEERAELEGMLAAAVALRTQRAAIVDEARGSQPVARARFERFMAQAPAAGHAPAASGGARHWWQRWPSAGALAGTVGAAAAAAVVAVIAVLAFASLDSPESASARVLEPGDYVEATGVVTRATPADGGQVVHLQSEFGDIVVSLPAGTTLTGAASGGVVTGDSLVVHGTVGKDRVVTAKALARLAEAARPPLKSEFMMLRGEPAGLRGRIVMATVPRDGDRARLLVDGGPGRRHVVVVEAGNLGNLVAEFGTALGVVVEVTHPTGSPAGLFVVTAATQSPPERTLPAAIYGTIDGRDGNILRVETAAGPVSVEIVPDTRIFVVPNSGLTVVGVLRGATAAGHTVTVTGVVAPATGHLVADAIFLGPKLAE